MNKDQNINHNANDQGLGINQDVIKGKWKQIQGKVREKWGDFTDDDLTAAQGSREYLVGKVQERYGRTQAQAEQEVRDFERTLDQSQDSSSLR